MVPEETFNDLAIVGIQTYTQKDIKKIIFPLIYLHVSDMSNHQKAKIKSRSLNKPKPKMDHCD